MEDFLTMDNYDFEGKTVLLRVDINSPVEEGKVESSDRLIESSKTIKELVDKGGKVVILAHQGRKGEPDFIHLKQHAEILSDYVGKKVEYIDDIIGEKAIEKIKSLDNGEVILLDNVRFLLDEAVNKSPEEHKKSELVQSLAPLVDVFVNDAFSAAHRSHASIVGFATLMPSLVGRIMEREVKVIKGIIMTMEISKHDTFVMGGAKPKDPLDVMEHMLEEGTLENVLVSGIVGELFLISKGYDLGKVNLEFLNEKKYLDFLPQTKRLLEKYRDNIKMPVDVAIEVNGKRSEMSVEDLPVNTQILDIGSKTIQEYGKIINESVTVGMKGPTGVYEKQGFEYGTKMILETIKDSKSISLIGGGHTLSALSKLGIYRH